MFYLRIKKQNKSSPEPELKSRQLFQWSLVQYKHNEEGAGGQMLPHLLHSPASLL